MQTKDKTKVKTKDTKDKDRGKRTVKKTIIKKKTPSIPKKTCTTKRNCRE